jgi:ParB family transcriptional regulator, chromosome partitioning protein
MAKRRRLDPARLIGTDASDAEEPILSASLSPMTPMPPLARRAPIADVAGDAASSAALAEVVDVLEKARAEGRMIQRLPLADIDVAYLVRDRIAADEDEMAVLCASIAARGQQTAIEVADLGAWASPRWGLISGWRRLTALRRLAAGATTPEEAARFGTVLALARKPAEAAEAYQAMVEENEIRVGLSYYERARIVARAVDKSVYADDRAGLSALFASASRAKRSKIGSFVRIVRALDGALRFPTGLTERTGLALAAALDADPGLEARLIRALEAASPATPEDEARVIAAALPRPPRATRPAPEPETVSMKGPVSIEAQADGRLILSGPLTTDAGFRVRLAAWLKAQE